jgi:hypothetical protein
MAIELKELDDCTPHDLQLEIRSLDCTQERAHEIKRYAYDASRKFYYEDDGGLAWKKVAEAVEDLWGDYVHFHTNDKF